MFRLHLNQDNSWNIQADEERSALLHEMVRVMELEPADSHEDAIRLVFTGSGNVSSMVPECDETTALMYEDSRLKLWWSDESKNAICEAPADLAGEDIYHTLRMVVQIIHHHNILQGGLTLHAALVELEGRGVLLAAKGGSGKSTCCRRLPGDWKVWCDDETLVTLDDNGKYLAHPFPTWSHYLSEEGIKTWLTETAVPVSAVCFLKQDENDGIEPLQSFEASMWVYHSVYPVYEKKFGKQLKETDKRSFSARLFHNACDMARTVPAYVLKASLHGRFWEEIEGVLDI
jgi:SynChlorMet cassette protein ScmC